jgi:atypical dual specificity phosphatase
MTKVWERLYVGCRKDAETLYSQNPHRITTVISLSEEPVQWRSRRINYLHFPTAPDAPMARGHFDSMIDAIAENIRWGTVLVQCAAGTNAAPVLVAAWMHVVGFKTIDAALDDIREVRPQISPSAVLLKSVKEHL